MSTRNARKEINLRQAPERALRLVGKSSHRAPQSTPQAESENFFDVTSLIDNSIKPHYVKVADNELPGLQRGDFLLVDRGVQLARDGDYITIEETGGIAVRIQKGGQLRLAQHKPAPIWGVGVAVIRQLRRPARRVIGGDRDAAN